MWKKVYRPFAYTFNVEGSIYYPTSPSDPHFFYFRDVLLNYKYSDFIKTDFFPFPVKNCVLA